MGLSIFFVDPSSIDSRVSITITLFLAAVAFNFIVADITPKISHSTYLSEFFFFTYAIILMMEVVENVIVSLIQKNAGDNAASIFDWVCLCVFAVFNFGYMMVFVIRGIRKGKKIHNVASKNTVAHEEADLHLGESSPLE